MTLTDCPVRGKDRQCAPVNRVTTWNSSGKVTDVCTCSCGRRFPTTGEDAPQHLVEPLPPGPADRPADGAGNTWTFDQVWPEDADHVHAVTGVTPVGVPVLHEPTQRVGPVTPAVKQLAKHMVRTMHRAPGVGLAANQVGAPLRMFVQLHKRAAPETWIDPEIRAGGGTWRYVEGCLSLQVEHSDAPLVRPKRIQVRGRTLHGDVVEATLDEVVARICQHEIDHLDGIEYVQRLTGDDADQVYDVLRAADVDVTWLPPRPY